TIPTRSWRKRPNGRWNGLEHFLERHLGVHQPLGLDRHFRLDQLAALDVVLGAVDAVERDDLPVAQVEHRKAARGRIAADDGGIVAEVEPDGLEAEIVLVRPEPRHRFVRLRIAADRAGHGARHVVGVLHAFEPYDGPVRPWVRMRRAVSDRIDIGQAGAAELVDIDAVGAGRPRGDQRPDRRDDADADDGHVAGQRLAARQANGGYAIAVAFEAFDLGAEADVHAVRAVLRLVEAGQILAGDAGEKAPFLLDHDDPAAPLAKSGGDLEADVAPADHDRLARVGVELGAQPVRVGLVAHRVDAAELRARTRETARIASGRPDQRAVGHGLPARERDGLGGRIDLGDRAAEQQLDPALGPELRRTDQDALERFLAGEVFLRQRRALVGRLAVATDHQHRTPEPLPAERDRRLRAAVSRADDDDIRAADHAPAPAVSVAAGCAPGWRSAPAWRARAARRLARGRSWCGTGR